MQTLPGKNINQAVLDINKEISHILEKESLNSNMGYEAVYAALIQDLSQALARWRLKAFERSEKRRGIS